MQLDITHDLVIQLDTVIFCVLYVLTVVAEPLWIQCPISTMCQLALSLTANIDESNFVLSVLGCFWALFHGHITD